MAVKASATITISAVVDVAAVYRYYLLQSSTLNLPSKPTTKPPGGNWTDTEPTYTSGSTNTLYFTDLTVFSDGTWSYSSVSRSSAYEAAKEAYNRATAAQTAASSAQADIDGLQIGGANLFLGTKDFSGDRWLSNGVPWWFAEEQYKGFNVFGTTYSYTAYYQNVLCTAGDVFTLSAYIWRRAAAGVAFMCANSDKHGTIVTSQIPNAETYTRVSISFTAQTTGEIHPSFATTVDGQSIRVCAIKLERGNRATDWSLAPEEVNTGIHNAQATANMAWSDIGNLRIGGRNLFTGTRNFDGSDWIDWRISSWTRVSADYNGFAVLERQGTWNGLTQSVEAAANEKFVLSAYIKRDADATVMFYCEGADKNGTNLTASSGTDWKRIEISFTIPTAQSIEPRFENGIDNKKLSICGMMLERGTRATDWSPAPEDSEEQIELRLENVHAQISETADAIRQEVQANYASASGVNQLRQQVTTLAEQTESNFTWTTTKITEMVSDMTAAQEATEEQLALIQTYMSFGQNGLTIGKTGNPFTFRVVNDRLAFYMNDTEVAYLSNNKLYVTQAEILTKMQIGKFAFEPQTNGNLSLIYTG